MTIHNPLKQLAEKKFRALFQAHVRAAGFPEVIKKAYNVSPPGSAGQSLRQIVVSTIAKHIKQIYSIHKDFKTMMEQEAAFGADLAVALTALIPEVPASQGLFGSATARAPALSSGPSFSFGNTAAQTPKSTSHGGLFG